MEKIFNEKIERFDKLLIEDLVEIGENNIKYAKTDAIICLAQKMYDDKKKIIKSFDKILKNNENFNYVSMNLPYNFLIIIVLIENLKEEDYEIVKSRFNLWKDSYKEKLISYLKDFPNHISILKN